MITPALVQASVVDIRSSVSATLTDLVTDANVLYWVFYPNFPAHKYAGGRQPARYQSTDYPRYWQRAAKAGTKFHTVTATLGEFAKAAEYAELEAIWLTDPNNPQPDPSQPVAEFSPKVCKFARYHYNGQLPKVRTDVEAMLAALRKSVNLLPQFPMPEDLYQQSMREWRSSWGDFPDAVLTASAKQQGKCHILSDDMDLATFPGTMLYTANVKTIDAARAAGKLIP